jgi:small subunit ribosomal protein S3Ae
MAKNDKKKVSKIKIKKKLWFKVVAPKLFGQKEIGESYLTASDKGVGRTLLVNLRDLTGSPRDQNAHVSFEITNVDGAILRTKTIGYKVSPSHIKRVVRKNTNRLDDVFTLKTKDGKEVIIKTLCITLNKVQRSTCSNLRTKLEELLTVEIGKADFDAFVGNLVSGKMVSTLKRALSKIQPLKGVTIRVLQLKKEKGKISGVVEPEASLVETTEEAPEAEEDVQPEQAEEVEASKESQPEAEETPAESSEESSTEKVDKEE